MIHKRNAVVLLGPPGSGKTSVAEKLAAQREMVIVDAERALRKEAELATGPGRQIRDDLSSGMPVRAELVIETVAGQIRRLEKGKMLVFDGFPSSKNLIAPFLRIGRESGFELSSVIILKISRFASVKRLTGRRICAREGLVYNAYSDPPSKEGRCDLCSSELVQCEEDTPEAVSRRMSIYERDTIPVLKYFKTYWREITREIPAEKPLDQVVEALLAVIPGRGRKPPLRRRKNSENSRA